MAEAPADGLTVRELASTARKFDPAEIDRSGRTKHVDDVRYFSHK
jgi:hypothetical protein